MTPSDLRGVMLHPLHSGETSSACWENLALTFGLVTAREAQVLLQTQMRAQFMRVSQKAEPVSPPAHQSLIRLKGFEQPYRCFHLF